MATRPDPGAEADGDAPLAEGARRSRRRWAWWQKAGAVLGCLLLAALCVVVAVKIFHKPARQPQAAVPKYSGAGDYQFAAMPNTGGAAAQQRATPAAAAEPVSAVRKPGSFGRRPSIQQANAAAAPAASAAAAGGKDGDDEKKPGLHPVRAWLPKNRAFIIPSRTAIVCSPEEPWTSETPGPVSCLVQGNIRGEDGTTILLHHNSVLEGTIGQASIGNTRRMVVAFDRARESISGLRIPLRGTGADQLGKNGVDGFYNDHLWERIRAGVILATIETAGDAAVAALQGAVNGGGSGNVGINFGGYQGRLRGSMSQSALQHDYQRRPTVERDHADTVTVKIIGDLDLSDFLEHRLVDERRPRR